MKLNREHKSIKIYFYKYRALFRDDGNLTNFLYIFKFLKTHLDKNDVKVGIVSFNNSNININVCNEFKNQYDFLKNVNFTNFKRIFPRNIILFQILEFLLNFYRFLYTLFVYKPNLIYAYGDVPLFLSILAKKIFSFKIIYDMRGDYLDELKKSGAPKMKLKLTNVFNNYSLKKCDLIFVVSDYYLKMRDNLTYIPKYNYYDQFLFNYNKNEMIKKKELMGLSEKFVFVYSGSSSFYQMVEEMIHFFSKFNKKYKNSFFMVFTENKFNDFLKYFDKYKVPNDSFYIKKISQAKLKDYLSIANIGFLLREDLPLNHKSFPTKFAEYLACGVPVLTTKNIYTIWQMVIKNDLGEIITLQKDYSEKMDKIYDKYFNNLEIKQHCADFASKKLMWQRMSKKHFNQIYGLKERK